MGNMETFIINIRFESALFFPYFHGYIREKKLIGLLKHFRSTEIFFKLF